MRFFLCLSGFLFLTAIWVAQPAEAIFRQDPGSGCLCPDDPFCDCGEPGPGGGDPNGTGECQKCGSRPIQNPGPYEPWFQPACLPKTDVGISRRECYIQPNGECYLTGASCSISMI